MLPNIATLKDLPYILDLASSGIIVQVGSKVKQLKVGPKEVVPFILSRGSCRKYHWHVPIVFENQFQPGFMKERSFAKYLRIILTVVNLNYVKVRVTFHLLILCSIAHYLLLRV